MLDLQAVTVYKYNAQGKITGPLYSLVFGAAYNSQWPSYDGGAMWQYTPPSAPKLQIGNLQMKFSTYMEPPPPPPPAAVPEPATFLTLGSALIGLSLFGRRGRG